MIRELVKTNQDFIQRVSKGDLAATDHLQALHEQAFPPELDRPSMGQSFSLPPIAEKDDSEQPFRGLTARDEDEE